MQLKKLLQGTAFAVVLAASAIAIPSVVKATEVDDEVTTNPGDENENPGDENENPGTTTPTTSLGKAGIASVDIYGDDATMDVTGVLGTQEILVGIGKVSQKKGTIAVSSWATYEGDSATVDLSKLSNVKDNYIVLSTPGKDVSIVKIPASDKSIKAKFDAQNGLQVGTAATGKASPAALTDATAAKYQYRTAYSNWESLADEGKMKNLSLYQEEGAKLFIRLKASGEDISEDSTEKWTYGNQKDIAVYKATTLPGKEAKVSIPAKAKGPKATADYAKGTVKFPKNSEYRLATSTRIYEKDEKPVDSPTDKTAVTKIFETFGLTEGNVPEVDIEVRTKATTSKAASKWGRLRIALPATIANDFIKVGEVDTEPVASTIEKDKEQKYGGKGVKNSELKETATGSNVLSIEYAGTAKKPTLKITNNSDKAYEFVKESAGATKVSDSAKATKAGSKKTITIKGIKDGEVIFVRAAGDKASQSWVGEYAKLGVIDLEKTVIGTNTDGSGSGSGGSEVTEPTDQELLNSLIEQLVETEVSLGKSAVNTPIPVAKENQTITWNQSASYTVSDKNNKTIEGVIATVEASEDNAYVGVDYENEEDSPVWLTARTNTSSFAGATETVTVTLKKGDVSSTKEVTIKLLAE